MTAFPYATLCVQGIKDGVTTEALQAQFEHYGRVKNVNINQNKNMKGAPDTRIAIVEFARRDDARKAMQGLNGRNVQGKCVMIRFARTAPAGMGTPTVRRGVPELIPQTASHEKLLAAKFRPADRSRSRSQSRSPKRRGRSSRAPKRRVRRSRSAPRSPVESRSRSRSASHWRPQEFSSPEPVRSRKSKPVEGSKSRSRRERRRRDSRSVSRRRRR